MHDALWKIRTEEVEEFILDQQAVVQRQIRADLDKLRLRGTKAQPPLVGHFEAGIYYLRSKCEPHGIFRVFYFQDGEFSFRAFDAFHKKRKKIPRRVRRRVLKRYGEIKEER